MDAHTPSEPGHRPGDRGPDSAEAASGLAAEELRGRITDVLLACGDVGDAGMLERLLPLAYDELRRIAHRQLGRERHGHTLNTTALVHEAYLRLVDQTRAQWVDRAHFFAVAAHMMRRILVGYARRYRAAKPGAGAQRIDLELADVPVEERSDALIALDDALAALAQLNPRLSRIVECRFFGGMTEQETAEALGITDRTVRRDWVKAKGWLHRELYPAGE